METVSLFPNGNSVLCAGCHTCKLLCPTHAISVDAHPADGPVMSVNQNLCVHCNLCSSRCPQCNCFTPDRASLGECFAVMASDEIRIKSASGGAFPVLASAIPHRLLSPEFSAFHSFPAQGALRLERHDASGGIYRRALRSEIGGKRSLFERIS